MIKKEAKTNLKIIFSAVVLLVVMMGVVNAWVFTFLNPPDGAKLNNDNRSLVLRLNVTSRPATGSLNISNITFFYYINGSVIENGTFIGINSSHNLTNYSIGWDISTIANGTYVLFANASNTTDGNTLTLLNSTNITIEIDAVYPTIISSYPVDASYSNGLIKINVSDANLQHCNISTNITGDDILITNFTNGAMTSGTTWTINLTESGYPDSAAGTANYSWNIWCNDTFGNANTSLLNANDSFILDTTYPVVFINGSIDNQNQTLPTVWFNFTITDLNPDTCLLYLNYTKWLANTTVRSLTSGTYNTTNATLPDGRYNWNIWCNDSAGNGAWNISANTMSTNNYTITVDSTVPAITVNNPTNGTGESSTTVTFNFTVTDLTVIDTCILKVGHNSTLTALKNWGFYNVTWGSTNASYHTDGYTFDTTTTLTDGFNYSWNVWCNDSLGNGNWSYTSNATFSVDTSSIDVTPNEPASATPTDFNFTDWPIRISVNVSGTNIDKVWFILSNRPTLICAASGTCTNETTNSNATIFSDTTNPMEYNLSITFSNVYTGPGDHGVWFCANNTAGTVTCNNAGAFSSGQNAGNSGGFIIKGTNVTQSEETFPSAMGSLNMTWENGTELPLSAFMDPTTNNYTMILNRTDNAGRNITVEIVGFAIDESRLANMSRSNQTVDIPDAVRDKIPGGYGKNITFSWMNVDDFLPDVALYKYGRVILPSEYQRVRYCNGTLASPTCYELTNCSAHIGINQPLIGNDTTYIPSSSGCYVLNSGKTYIYVDHFGGGGGENDTTAPNITFTYPVHGANVSDNTTLVNLSFVDAGVGIDNSTYNIEFTGNAGTGSTNYTITNISATGECYNISYPSQKNPLNASHVQCYFTTSYLGDGTWNMTVTVADSEGNEKNASINFTIDTVPPTYNAWNITNHSDRYSGATRDTGNWSNSVRQGVTVRAFVNFSDATSDTESAYLQVYNTTPSTPVWQNITAIFDLSAITLIGNSSNFNQSLVTDGALLNATYTFCSDAACYQSGANVSFRIYAIDSAGNENNTISTNLTVTVNDTVKPAVTFRIKETATGTAKGNFSNISTTSFYVNISITERNNLSAITYSVNGVTSETTTCLRYVSRSDPSSYKEYQSEEIYKSGCGATLSTGTHYIVFNVTDSWGNQEITNYTFMVDTTVPYGITIGFDSTDVGVAGGDDKTPTNLTNYGWALINVSYSGSGLTTLQYNTSCNGTLQTISNATKFQPFNNTACIATFNGTKNLTVVATSGSGGANTTIFSIGLDNTAPTVTLNSINSITSVQGREFVGANISLNFSFSDFTYISSVGYYLDGNPLVILASGNVDQKVSYNYSINVTYGGTHTLTLEANDSVGNAANATTYTFTVIESVDIAGKQAELNASLGPAVVARLLIRNATGATGTPSFVTINSSALINISIDLELNGTKARAVNITIEDINASAVRWEYLNFSVVGNRTTSENSIKGNFSAIVLKIVEFDSSIDDFIPNASSYYGRVVVPYNVTSTNDSKFIVYYFDNESDYSSETSVGVCSASAGGKTGAYTRTQTIPCYNVTANFSTTIFVPHFSTVTVVNDTMAPTVAVNIPTVNEGDSAFLVNVTVSQDTSTCKFMVNASGYYNGAAYTKNTWKTMTKSALTGTSQYICLSSPLALINTTGGAPNGAYNLTLNITDGNNNQNITYHAFNVTDSVPPQYSEIANSSITSSSATITLTSNEYVNASVNASATSSSTIFAQTSPFTIKTPTISLAGLSASTTYSYNVTVCDYAGNCNTSSKYNFTTSAAAAVTTTTTTTTGGGTTGGITVVAPTNIEAKTSHLWSSLTAGETVTMKIVNEKIGFKEVQFTTVNALTSVKLEVASLKEKPETLADASDKVYQYLQVTPKNVEDGDISSAKIKFEVTKAWLTDNNIAENDITLLRYKNNKWNILPTKLVTSGALKVTYEATTPGFSYFAIGSKIGVKEVALPEEVVEEEEKPPVEEVVEEEKIPITPPKPISTTVWIVIAIIAVIIIGIIVYSIQAKKPAKKK